MQIRKATYQDARRISYLIKKNAEYVKENKHTPAQKMVWKNENTIKATKIKLKQREVFCAFENDRLVGTIGLEGKYLVGVYISYTKRGQGLGKKLLDFIENYAKKNNIPELHLTATPNGYGFYLKNGYQPYGQVDLYFDGVLFIETKMAKTLKI